MYDSIEFGAEQLLSFTIFLSSVETGGNKVFPQSGLSITPTVGSALFWFNIGPQHNFDTRTVHLDCPMRFGNKWTLTKWIPWGPSFKTYPCFQNKPFFSIFDM